MKKYIVITIVLIIIVGLALFLVLKNDSSINNSTETVYQQENIELIQENEPKESADSISSGSYVSYEDYQSLPEMYNDGKIVYFFNAKWCPTCKALNTDIVENGNNIPSGVTIVSVDYDNYTELKKQYGVTYQHTMVQVDKNGNQIKKWSGGNTLDSVLRQI